MIRDSAFGIDLPPQLVFHDRLVTALASVGQGTAAPAGAKAGVLHVQHRPDAPLPFDHRPVTKVQADQSVLMIVGPDAEAQAQAFSSDHGVDAAGFAIYPGAAEDPDSLITAAAEALKESLRQGGRLIKAPPKVEPTLPRFSFDGAAPSIRYQPKFELKQGRPIGVELLVRFGDGNGGELPFDESMTRGLDPAVLDRVTCATLEGALAECRAWAAAGIQPLSLAINVSLAQFAEGRLTAMLDRLLRHHASGAWPIVLEITETEPPGDLEQLLPHLHDARALGLELSLDDLGSGYANLELLARLPLDEVKIDRSYINPPYVTEGWEDGLRNLVGFAQGAGLRVVAEGVETARQKEALVRIGCDCCQGYFVSPPLEADALKSWVLTGGGARL